MSRGKLPRSFKILLDDPLNGEAIQDHAFIYDCALAIIATTGARNYSLAKEIIFGVMTATTMPARVPYVANHLTGIRDFSAPYLNVNRAAVAYAYGYYLELNSTDGDYCAIELSLRHLLNYLLIECDRIHGKNLIHTTSTNASILTESCLWAYFALKQAGKILNHAQYDDAAEKIKDDLVNVLWSDFKLNKGMSSSGVLDTSNALEVHALGAIFFAEVGEMPKANACLQKCEEYGVVDETTGAVGYTRFLGTPDNVWFEMSYAIAVGYYKVGNLLKYNQIINELNRYIDTTDGGFTGTLLKTYTDETMIEYKAVGSTAWAIIANLLKASAFKIRNNVFTPAYDCFVPYYNTEQSETFYKIGCEVDENPTSFTYIVPAGRYFSYLNQTAADDLALDEIAKFGQEYVNTYGQCIPIANVGNELMSEEFIKAGCPSGFHGSTVEYIIPANTYYAATLSEANDLAQDDIDANGQTYANTNGICIPDLIENLVYMVLDFDSSHMLDRARAYSVLPVDTDIVINFSVYDDTNTEISTHSTTIYAGDSSSLSTYLFVSGVAPYYGVITSITPSTSGTMEFVF